MAAKLDVTTQMVYDWQNGKNSVSDDRAEQIAEVLHMSVIGVRRGLGLWVPQEHREEPSSDNIADLPMDELIQKSRELLAQLAERERAQREDEDRQERRSA